MDLIGLVSRQIYSSKWLAWRQNNLHYVTIGVMKLDIEAFLQYLTKDKGYSQNTLAAYRNDLTQMVAFISTEQAKGIITSYGELLKSYLLKLREKRYSVATTARKVASTKSFFRFMVDSGRMRENPAQHCPRLKLAGVPLSSYLPLSTRSCLPRQRNYRLRKPKEMQ